MTRLLVALVAFILLVPGASLSEAQAANIFSVDCKFSHQSFDDPIVYAGLPGAAHSHEFTGAWSTNALSTLATLLGSGTTCLTNKAEDPLADKSAYWAPTLFQDGERVPLKSMSLYISLGEKNNPEQISKLRSFPPGLKMIADIKNSYRFESGGWGCGGEPNKVMGITPGPEIVPCPGGIQNGVVFPDCWDGVNLDSPDHRSHMAYTPPGSSNCPASHPVYLPQIFIKHVYDREAPGGRGEGGGYTLAEGQGGTEGWTGNFHSDFINAWDQDELDFLVQHCLKEGKAQSNTRPCLGPQLPQGEIEAAEKQRTNLDSPHPTPSSTHWLRSWLW
jgi:hypothetical protein